MTVSAPINPDTYASLQENLGEILPQLKTAFLEDAPILLEKIKTGLVNNDMPTVFSAAHTLKSSAQNMGADMLAQYSLEIEAGTTLDIAQLVLLQQQALAEMKKVHSFLESID